MTREEAIAYGEDYLKDLISACCHIEEKHKDFVRMAIKALEQEPCDNVLDKISAEIKSMDFDFGDFYDHTNQIIKKVCEVIDKCREEQTDV